jgi:hypothetical protein
LLGFYSPTPIAATFFLPASFFLTVVAGSSALLPWSSAPPAARNPLASRFPAASLLSVHRRREQQRLHLPGFFPYAQRGAFFPSAGSSAPPLLPWPSSSCPWRPLPFFLPGARSLQENSPAPHPLPLLLPLPFFFPASRQQGHQQAPCSTRPPAMASCFLPWRRRCPSELPSLPHGSSSSFLMALPPCPWRRSSSLPWRPLLFLLGAQNLQQHLPPPNFSCHGRFFPAPYSPMEIQQELHFLHGRRPAQRLCATLPPQTASPLPRCSSWCPPAVRQNAQQAARCSNPPVHSPLPRRESSLSCLLRSEQHVGIPAGCLLFCAAPLSSSFTPVRPRRSLFDSASTLFSYD